MNRSIKLYHLTLSAVLCAIGIVIPCFSPIKILIEPASFTLASHVAIFIAMFISPAVAISVTIGTTLGFFLAGFPIVVVLRAASQIIFAGVGAYIIKTKPEITETRSGSFVFSAGMALIHAIGEILVVIPFYFGNGLGGKYYENGFVYSVLLLVGIGTVIHSLIDFEISYYLWKPVKKSIAVN